MNLQSIGPPLATTNCSMHAQNAMNSMCFFRETNLRSWGHNFSNNFTTFFFLFLKNNSLSATTDFFFCSRIGHDSKKFSYSFIFILSVIYPWHLRKYCETNTILFRNIEVYAWWNIFSIFILLLPFPFPMGIQ